MTRKFNKSHAILAVIIILAVFVPQHQARAWCASVNGCALDFGKMILGWVGTAVGWAAQAFDSFLQWQTTSGIFGIAAVTQSWTLIRNFVNLLFILVLIIMAFGTIFNIRRYTWKEMLAPFLIAALLINFSLTIGQYIITVSNGLAGVFLREMGASVSLKFAQGFSIPNVVTATTGAGGNIVIQTADALASSTTTLIFGIIWLVIVFLAFLSAFIFSIARVFVLLFLLIISPIAWLGYALPNLRSQTWDVWWKNFLCWCFFLPYYLFFLMFAVIFINNRNQLQSLPGSASIVLGSLTLNNLVVYGVSLIFLIGGLVIAVKLACASGTGVKAVFGKIETGVRKYAPGAAYVRAGYTGAKEGLAAKGAEIRERGIPIGFGRRFGGEQAERLRTARVAEAFGMGAKVGEAGRVQMVEIEKEAKRVREQLIRTPADDQKKFLQDQKDKGGLIGQAAELEFVKQGYSQLEDYVKAVERNGGENNAFMRQYLENLKQAKNSDLYQSSDQELRIAKGGDKEEYIALVNLRRELYKDLAKRNQISNLKDYKEAKQLLGSIPAELKSFLDSIKPEYIVATREARQDAIGDRTLGDEELERKLVEFMKDKKEINDVQLRQSALDIVKSGTTAGKDTIEGRNIINEINKFNPIINIEAEIREEREVPIGPLDEESQKRIVRETSDKIRDMQSGDIRKLSKDFFKNPTAQEALRQAFTDDRGRLDSEGLSELLKDAPQEMRRALKNLPKGGGASGAEKGKIGFIS